MQKVFSKCDRKMSKLTVWICIIKLIELLNFSVHFSMLTRYRSRSTIQFHCMHTHTNTTKASFPSDSNSHERYKKQLSFSSNMKMNGGIKYQSDVLLFWPLVWMQCFGALWFRNILSNTYSKMYICGTVSVVYLPVILLTFAQYRRFAVACFLLENQ